MRHGRRLAVAGIRVADAPRVAIDLGDGAVRVPAPVLSFHRDALDALDATLGAATGSVHVAAGRYPINAWAVPLDPMSDSPARRLAAVVGLLERIPDVDRAQESLELLRDHLAETLAVPVVPDGPVALLAAVLELFDGR